MRETAFTPGPWEYNSPEIFEQVPGKLSDVAVYARGNKFPWRMAEVVGPDNVTTIATARLIAAAPDLYEALENARALWGHRSTDAPQLAWLATVDAALAKARGETP